MDNIGFPFSIEAFVGTLTSLLMSRGVAKPVAVIACSNSVDFEYDPSDNWNDNVERWQCVVRLPVRYYGQLSKSDIDQSAHAIREASRELLRSTENHYITNVKIVPTVEETKDYREEAAHWLNGEGVNNQGRVRSDNIASREFDGLLFRSKPEILVYQALKDAGITFAPLPVFLRGGQGYRRLEPDFVIWQDGILVLLEIDGDTVHKETPAEAAERLSLFEEEGAIIRRLAASKCDTPDKAYFCVNKLIEYIKKRKEQR